LDSVEADILLYDCPDMDRTEFVRLFNECSDEDLTIPTITFQKRSGTEPFHGIVVTVDGEEKSAIFTHNGNVITEEIYDSVCLELRQNITLGIVNKLKIDKVKRIMEGTL
jgi:hypothetical protein